MDPNDRPVHVRTSASARDFWSKVRDESEVSPDGKVLSRMVSARKLGSSVAWEKTDSLLA